MSRYEQPGFAGAFPTGPLDAGSLSNAPGSAGAPADADGNQGGGVPVHVSFSFDSSQAGGYSVDQGPKSTNAASDPLLDKVSGTVTPTSWAGHVCGPSHPNAGS